MKPKINCVNFIKGTVLLSAIILAGCATRSEVPQPPINIPSQYAYKMDNELDKTGFQLGAMDYKAIPKYNKAILKVQMSDQLVEPGTFDRLKTGYLFYSDQDIVNIVLPSAQESFRSAFSSSKYFKLTSTPGPGTLKINVYITEIVINDAFFGSISNIPSPGWIIWKPIGMGIAYISNKAGGAVAIEVVVTDSMTNKVVAVFQDREKGVFALCNSEGFFMTASGRRNLDFWAQDLASTLDQVKAGKRYPTASKIAPLIEWFYLDIK